MNARLMQLDELTLGKIILKAPRVLRDTSADISNGIGADVLQRFHLVIDFPNQTLYLTPDPDYKEPKALPAFMQKPLANSAIPAPPCVIPFKTTPVTSSPLVSVSLNGKPPRLFLISPESSGCLIDRAYVNAEKFTLQQLKPEDGPAADAIVADTMTLQSTPPIESEKAAFFVEDLSQLRRIGGTDVVGILGSNYLGVMIERIDFSKQQITVYPREGFTPPGKQVHRIPLVEQDGDYMLEAKVDGKSARFAMNFSESDSYVQESSLLSTLHPVAKLQEVGAEGVKGTQKLRLHSVEATGAFWSDPILIHSPDPTNTVNLLGTGFFSRFYVTLDLGGKQLYLEPDPNYREDLSSTVSSGFNTQLDSDGKLKVSGIYVPSSASEAGIKVGDEILEINGLPTATTPMKTLFKSVKRVEGTSVKVKVQRKGEEKPREVTLKIHKLL